MQIQSDIGFEQLLKIVKSLPQQQQKILKTELEKEVVNRVSDLESLLLAGPVATKEQLETIENNRKELNQWRTR